MAEQMGYDTGQDETYAVIALVIVMALNLIARLVAKIFAPRLGR